MLIKVLNDRNRISKAYILLQDLILKVMDVGWIVRHEVWPTYLNQRLYP